ncbi:MAG TPA: cell wall-binding repeat-containing protein [Actinomycetes bacterium]
MRSRSGRAHGAALALSAALLLAAAAPAMAGASSPTRTLSATSSVITVSRLDGASRYETAAQVAGQYSPGVPAVYIATGRSFADALAAGPAAGSTSPLLIVDGGTVPAAVSQQVARLTPGIVILVGGPAAVPDSVGQALGVYATGGWKRLAGASRFETAVAVSQATFNPGVPVAFVATGRDFPDALTGAALGARLGGPVLLTDPATLPTAVADELKRLQPAKIEVLGGTAAVSGAVYGQLASFAPTVERRSGSDRYQTNAAALALLGTATTAVVATGGTFPDALTGSALAGLQSGALVLTGTTGPVSAVLTQVSRIHPTGLIVVGGPAAVPDAALVPIRQALGDLPPGVPTAFAVNTKDGQTLRWNPCAPIGYRVNPGSLGSGVLTDVQAALARISAASGLSFSYAGTTTFVPSSTNTASAPAALVVAVAGPTQTDLYASGAIGEGGWSASGVSNGSSWVWKLVHGYVVIDPASTATTTAGFAQGDDRGPLLLHEIGHAVGLNHVTDPLEIMYPVLSPTGPVGYGAGDLAGLQAVGSSGGCIG